MLGNYFFIIKQKFNKNYNSESIKNKKQQLFYVFSLSILPIAMIWQIYDLDYRANLFPISLSIITYFLLTIIFFIKTIDLTNSPIKNNLIFNFININIYEKDSKFNNQFFYYLSILSYLLMNFIFGFPIASVIFINVFILFHDKSNYKIAILISLVLLFILWILATLLTLQFPNGLIGLFIDMPWWLVVN